MTAVRNRTIVLDCGRVGHDGKSCWKILDVAPDGDTQEDTFRSRARLLEDGQPLGPGHANHDEIRWLGGGRYSHWGTALYFSTSDNSDPRSNGRHYAVEILPEGTLPVDMPATMHVGITSACNLTCRICRTDEQAHGNTLSDEVIDRLVEEVFPTLKELRLDVAGEPTLHRRKFERLVSEATRHGVNIFMCTNAVLVDEALAEFICNSSMYKVQLSVDSPDPARLEWVRRGVTYDGLVAGIRNLVKARRAAGREGDLNFNLHAAILRQTIDDLPDLVRFAHDLGVEQVSNYFGFIHSYMDVDWSPFWEQRRHNDKIDEAKKLGDELGVRFSYWGKFNPDADHANRPARTRSANTCRYVHQWTYVDPSGYLAPCCISPNHNLGSLKLQPFREVWYGPAYEDLRRTHATDTPSNPKCASCYMMVGWDKDSYQPYFAPEHWPEVRRRLGLPEAEA